MQYAHPPRPPSGVPTTSGRSPWTVPADFIPPMRPSAQALAFGQGNITHTAAYRRANLPPLALR